MLVLTPSTSESGGRERFRMKRINNGLNALHFGKRREALNTPGVRVRLS